MAARVTQEALEALVLADNRGRVTQVSVENLTTPESARGRSSQVAGEVLAQAEDGQGRASQVAVEVLLPAT